MLCKLLVVCALSFLVAPDPPKGRLVIVGGGEIGRSIRERTIALAGGTSAKILVIPYASPDPEAGAKSAKMWEEVGATQISVLDLSDPKAAIQKIRSADLIWMRGGSQSRLMEHLRNPELVEAIRARYLQGGTIGGTSAGAAVMSSLMIADWLGPRNAPDGGRPRMSHGLGLWPEVIVDQHFIRRKRMDRLRHAIEDHPELVGVGIDESTAVIVSGRGFEVMGASDVIVYDARKPMAVSPAATNSGESAGNGGQPKAGAEPEKEKGPKAAETEYATHTLHPGMKFDLDRGVLTATAAATAPAATMP